MKKFIDDNLKKIILCSIVIAITLLIVLTYLIISSKINVKSFENDTFSIKYDTTWKITKNDDNYISLRNGKDSQFEISINSLPEEQKYDKLESLIEEVEYGIGKQNEGYSLIAKEKIKITSKNVTSYKFLYEKDSKQVLVVVAKIEDKLIVFNYLSSNNYFDILLDSIHNIIYNFNLSKEKVDFKTEIKGIKSTKIEWDKNIKVDKTREYSLANNYYLVNYKLPNQFQLSKFDNIYGYFSLKEDGKTISASSAIKNYNIYEWLNVDNAGLIQSEIKYIKKNFTDVKVEASENNMYEGSYIYKITYNNYNEYTKTSSRYETVYIVYPLDYMRLFEIKLEARDISISYDIINNINMIKKEKIASFVYRNIDNGYIINEMKRFTDYEKTNYYNIKLHTPEKWTERTHTYNVYETRKFGLNCSEELSECEYNLSYWLGNDTYDVQKRIEKARDNLVESALMYNGAITYNGETYESYSTEYEKNVYGMKTEKHKFYEEILYKELDKDNYLIIKLNKIDIRDNTSKISEVLKIDITKEVYK